MSYPNQYTPTPQRSAIPKVMGILMIIFGSLAILGGLVGLAMGGEKQFAHIPEWRAFEKVSQTMSIIGFPISILGFVTGICALGYKRVVPKLALVYGVLAMIHTVIAAVINYKYMTAAMDAVVRDAGGFMGEGMGAIKAGMGIGTVIGIVFGLAYPILVLVLLTRPNAKASCVN